METAMDRLEASTGHRATRAVVLVLTHPAAAIIAGATLSYVARASLSPALLVVAQTLLLSGTRRGSRRDLVIAFVATWLAAFATFHGVARELSGGDVAYAVTMGIGSLLGLATLAIDRY